MSTKIAGLLGWPARQSLSPIMFGHWLAENKIQGVYVPLPTAPADFVRVVDALPRMGVVGVNVTIPHKEAAFALADALDESARICGAVNMLTFEGGKILGRNTDILGFSRSLTESFGAAAALSPVAVLGAGGAARAIVAALGEMQCPDIRIINRTLGRAQSLVAAFPKLKTRAFGWNEWDKAFDGVSLLVNTASIGMLGKEYAPVNLDVLPKTSGVLDIVYNPLETELMREAKSRGHRVEGGLPMLMYQAAPCFETWFGVAPRATPQLRGSLEAAING